MFILSTFNQHRRPQSQKILEPGRILEKENAVKFLYFSDEEMNPREMKGLALSRIACRAKHKI